MQLNGKRVSRETQERLEHFAGLFRKWASRINLVAPSTINELWDRHIADSAQLFQLRPEAATWVDLGSGGGFPGIITAILLKEIDGGWVHLVESNQKKASFLRVALMETEARGTVYPARIDEAAKQIEGCDYLSARALAELDLLLQHASPWLSKTGARAFFHKGRDYQREIGKARGAWDFDLVEHPSAVESDSIILEVSNLRPKDR
ncbi:MAG: 16S rRNA (guanine(527)-N(7))-methyltransferase RsmG [Alphaproteobacteria bacterium]|nr:16S rRNA (guanine(527)-N(7))-methyltransferase RsmG [Hyphomicrobiales bacterium]MBU1312732.1 16S rRNA (guanine(527)-N(7))-methyltransferase RsmG [Alphaproteobacteria bacterium]MBU1548584.1 16S rRNA (guanine(527)-N(7))-methyltransferase RsmG [Alphaproteobacteria bacterium]MBU2338221.1 16S rRNA (guanine(527)-N(7))-methyltransferase RsmG [Alphaproteobacteria bacterium]MBU2389768.1 16S rRNA (guanine(527)-N(7))-methyltransferase RsmG [Alphaproteobacteria bacterium]